MVGVAKGLAAGQVLRLRTQWLSGNRGYSCNFDQRKHDHETAQTSATKTMQTKEIAHSTTCTACANVIASETSTTRLRCAKTYYAAPPSERRVIPVIHYPEVLGSHTCDDWQAYEPSVLAG